MKSAENVAVDWVDLKPTGQLLPPPPFSLLYGATVANRSTIIHCFASHRADTLTAEIQ